MEKTKYYVIGVMSGTSLDGIDLAYIRFDRNETYSFKILTAQTFEYPESWKRRLEEAVDLDSAELDQLDKGYTQYLAGVINEFIARHQVHRLDLVCSHGHTVKHQPHLGITLQIGNRPELSTFIHHKVVCDFRVQDVAMGGQGAPLVPIGDKLLFGDYQYCLNLGGFANISENQSGRYIAYDICAVNTVLNHFAGRMGLAYDDRGKIAESGSLNRNLLGQLNELEFFMVSPPKSLGIEWVKKELLPLLNQSQYNIPEVLHTFSVHVAMQVSKVLNDKDTSRVLVTGGGAKNDFLISLFRQYSNCHFVIPESWIIDFKEALIFGLLGVLKVEGKVNVLSAVTGARADHSSGKIFYGA